MFNIYEKIYTYDSEKSAKICMEMGQVYELANDLNDQLKENGRIAIDEEAANLDISNIRAASEIFDDTKQIIKAIIGQTESYSGETITAIHEKATELLNLVENLDLNLEETSEFIKHVVEEFKRTDIALSNQMKDKVL